MKKVLLTLLLVCSAAGVLSKDKVVIRRNQVGCLPQQDKVVVIEGVNPSGKLRVTTPDGRVLKAASTRKSVSPLSGKTRYVVNLGQLSDAGSYKVSIGGEQCTLLVSAQPYHDLASGALRLFYLMRSGVPIVKGGPYNRPAGHADTRVLVHPSAASAQRPAGTVISSPYGWYDAGDYNKYVVNSAFSIGLMFAAYEQQKAYFARLSTDIPESGNRTPDFLDEMMFNLRWLFTMQDPGDGGVYHKLTNPNFEGFVMPTACRQPRYVVAKSVTATLDFAAVMADAARLYEPFQVDYPGFSAQAAAVAERAYQWAKSHPDAFYRQEMLTNPAVSTGTYGDGNARDEFFWAASALFRLTGNKAYLDDAQKCQPSRFTVPTWGNVAALGAFEWLCDAKSGELRQPMLNQLVDYCDAAVKGVEASSFQSPFGNKAADFGWGCLAEHCCCQALALLYADQLQGGEKYRRFALQNVDYLLGRNATGYCFVTGFGDVSPMHPHHRISEADGVEAPFPGMLVGGPNPGQQDKSTPGLVYPSDIADESYVDNMGSYASNEIAINWNASLVALMCWVDALSAPLPTDVSAQPVGWASVDGTTTGGRGENPVVVTNFDELRRALASKDTTFQTVYLKGRIDVPGLLRVRGMKNKSVIGLPGSALVNDKYTIKKDETGILMLDDCHNIILQNITFLGPGAFDRDASDNLCLTRSTRIWVDHCDFQDGMDGNFDSNAGSDYITVSWCRFRYLKKPWPKLADDQNDDHNSDHRFSNLWGSSDRDMRSEGRLRTTFSHCWWDEGCKARMPFVRFGQIHLLNCLYSSSEASVYVQSRFRSNVLVEGCVFTNVPRGNKIFQTPFSSKPEYQDFNIRFRGCIGAEDMEQRHGDADYFTPPYQYTASPASAVEKTVRARAGATLNTKYQ